VLSLNSLFFNVQIPEILECAVAVRGKNGREGCKFPSLVEYLGLSPWQFLSLVVFPVTPAVLILSNS